MDDMIIYVGSAVMLLSITIMGFLLNYYLKKDRSSIRDTFMIIAFILVVLASTVFIIYISKGNPEVYDRTININPYYW